MTLVEAIAAQPYGYDYQFDSIWSIERNFGIKQKDLDAYCAKHGIIIQTIDCGYSTQLYLHFDKNVIFNAIKDSVFIERATIAKLGHFEHFGIHEITANIYGNRKEDIKTVELTIADD
jgi:hypothetical protein